MALNWQWADKCGEIEIRPYEMAGAPRSHRQQIESL